MSTRPGEKALNSVFVLIEAAALHCHETTEGRRLEILYHSLQHDRVLEHPVLVDKNSLVILDGHHRFACLKELGCSLIPAYLVDYQNPAITVETRRENTTVSKRIVIKRGLSAQPFPPRTTRHRLEPSLPPYPVRLTKLMTVRSPWRLHTAAPSPNWRA